MKTMMNENGDVQFFSQDALDPGAAPCDAATTSTTAPPASRGVRCGAHRCCHAGRPHPLGGRPRRPGCGRPRKRVAHGREGGRRRAWVGAAGLSGAARGRRAHGRGAAASHAREGSRHDTAREGGRHTTPRRRRAVDGVAAQLDHARRGAAHRRARHRHVNQPPRARGGRRHRARQQRTWRVRAGAQRAHHLVGGAPARGGGPRGGRPPPLRVSLQPEPRPVQRKTRRL